jgi:hypothetical protein
MEQDGHFSCSKSNTEELDFRRLDGKRIKFHLQWKLP